MPSATPPPEEAIKFSMLMFLTGLAALGVGALGSTLVQGRYAPILLGVKFCVHDRHVGKCIASARGSSAITSQGVSMWIHNGIDSRLALVGYHGESGRRH